MAESMQGLHRTCRCAEVTTQMVGSEVTLMGWVQKARDKGGIIFVDLRDRSGIMQLIFENGSIDEEGFAKAGKLRSEFVIAVTGTVEKRGGAVNENLATGEIEVRAKSLRVLSEAEVPPFPVEENSKTKEDVRLKYRYLDLRRPDLQRNLILREPCNAADKIRSLQTRDSWRLRLLCLERVLRKVQEIIWYHPVYILAASMVCRSHRSCTNSF